jgi:hypothetical protein
MKLAFSQMLQGVGFVPGLQSPYSQGQYPLALGFKSPTDAHPMPLPALVPAFTLLATLLGIPALVFAWTKRTAAHPAKAVNIEVRSQYPFVHKVEVLLTLLLKPSMMKSLKRLRQGRRMHPDIRIRVCRTYDGWHAVYHST